MNGAPGGEGLERRSVTKSGRFWKKVWSRVPETDEYYKEVDECG